MKIEAGRVYKTRDGRRVDVLFIIPGTNYFVVVGRIEGYPSDMIWTIAGSYWSDGSESDLDLVSEWTPPVSEWPADDTDSPESKTETRLPDSTFWTAARSVLGRESDHAGIMQSLAEKLGVGPEPPPPPIEGWIVVCASEHGPWDKMQVAGLVYPTREAAEAKRQTWHRPDAWEIVRVGAGGS